MMVRQITIPALVGRPDLLKLAGLIYGSTGLQLAKGSVYIETEGTIELGSIELDGFIVSTGYITAGLYNRDFTDEEVVILKEIIGSFNIEIGEE